MGFDLENFGLGLLAGWVSAYGVYRARRQIAGALQTTRSQATSAQNYATRSADSRYLHDLVDYCETQHLAGDVVRLTDILVEPRFLPAPELAAPPDDEVIQSVYHVIPQIHDHPYLHAVYNPETLSIADLATGDRGIALLGLPGSGRTTALLSIALHSLGQMRIRESEDKLQRNLDEEEAALTEKERAARIQERNRIEERARERLKEEHGITVGTDRRTGPFSFNQLMPVYVHLANVTINTDEFGSQIDPAEPLVRAVQSQVGRITAGTLPRHLYRRLNTGDALLLIDGLDDLPPQEQSEKRIWLRQLMVEYGQNFFIVAGPAHGYGALTDLGLAPVFLRPWDDRDITALIDNWAGAWPRIAGKGRRRPAPAPTDTLLERARANNRAMPPTDLIFKTWATFADDAQAAGHEGWLRAYISRHLPKDQSIGIVLPRLAQYAALQLDEGFITVSWLEKMVGATAGDEAALNALLDRLRGDESADSTEAEPAASGKKSAQSKNEDTSVHGKLLNALQRTGLFVVYRGDRYQFRHSSVAAYLASLTLKDQATLAAKADNPAWRQALAYAGLHTDVAAAVHARMSAPPDLLYSNLLEPARWLAYAGAKATWGGMLLKQLGNMVVSPNQYPLLRERAAAALITTRDKKTLFVFRQAARSANAHVRMLGCLGMGAVGDPEAINDLIPLLDDQQTEVQMAAAMALGAIGTDEALEAMVFALTEGGERLRQAVAEALAAIPEEGHPILFDGITHEDMMVRRAAAFGLRRLRTRWSLSALYRAFLEDQQWYVRSAAQQAFQEIQAGAQRGPRAYQPPHRLSWLSQWAAARGEGIPTGEAAADTLINALREGEPEIRVLSARVLGQTGKIASTRALYNALRDRQEDVRVAAYQSLADLEMQLGQPMPAPS
jgi:HEAT repeat protein